MALQRLSHAPARGSGASKRRPGVGQQRLIAAAGYALLFGVGVGLVLVGG
jgi:hypothetical protein